MGAELLRGQNHPLTRTGLLVRLTAGCPAYAGAVMGSTRLAHPGAPVLPGVEVPDRVAADHVVAVDLGALAAATADEREHRLTVLLALPPAGAGPARFGSGPAPRATVTGTGGEELAAFTLTGLGPESAVAVLEFYRRAGGWRVRAVGQGYAGGLAAMLADHGLPDPALLAAGAAAAVTLPSGAAPPPPAAAARPAGVDYRHPGRPPARPAGPPAGVPAQRSDEPDPVPQAAAAGPSAADLPDPDEPVAGDAVGWTMEERLHNQVRGMFEDLTRSIAAYRSATDFAESRLAREVDAVLADPATRFGPAAEAARERAQARRDELADQARAALDHDLRQLTAESRVVEPALPPPFAGWESPVWHGYRAPHQPPSAVRLGDIHLPEVPELRIPMLERLPLARPLWVDSGAAPGGDPAGPAAGADRVRQRAGEVAAALAVRLLAAHPVGGLAVHLVDPLGTLAGAFAPLARSGALCAWPPADAGGVAGALAAMTRRVDLVRMALRAGSPEALPPDLDTSAQLLVVGGFPHDFDDRAVGQLRYVADEGPEAGVHLLLVADRADAQAFGPVLDPLWRATLRLTPFPDDHLADPWVGQIWTYEPLLPPEGSAVLEHVLGEIAQARQAHGS